MTNIYHIDGFFAQSEEDIYNEGCQSNGTQYNYDQSFDASTEQGLIDAICKHFDVEKDALELNACGEDGRIDIARMECEDGTQATESELAAWKEGKKRLFYVVYTGNLEIKTAAKFTL